MVACGMGSLTHFCSDPAQNLYSPANANDRVACAPNVPPPTPTSFFPLFSEVEHVNAIGCVSTVLEAMAQHTSSSSLCESGIATLSNLAVREDYSAQIVGIVGGVEAVVSALKAHEGDLAVQVAGCVFVHNITTNSGTAGWKGEAQTPATSAAPQNATCEDYHTFYLIPDFRGACPVELTSNTVCTMI